MPELSNARMALIVVDYQNDFCHPQGALYIPQGEVIQPNIIQKIKQFKREGQLVVASKDWHPPHHSSFNIWPVHAVAGTWGAKIPFGEQWFDLVIKKGQQPTVDSYSAFFDHAGQSNGLHEQLQTRHVQTVVIVGLATDVCVSATAQHAIELGYKTIIDLECCRGQKNRVIFEPPRQQER